MEIRTWEVSHIFEPHLRGKDIQMIGVPLPKPAGLDERIKANWDRQLLAKQSELGPHTEIRPYHVDRSDGPLNALYRGQELEMWPGPTVTLREVERDLSHGSNRLILKVGQIFYPYVNALKDPEVIKLYEAEALDRPTSALGICTPVLTADNRLVLTARAKNTNIYPGRVHSPGGQPETPDTDVVKHQVDEVRKEVLIEPEELVGEFLFTGIVLDQDYYQNKPDLTGWVMTSLDAGDIRERMLKTDPAKREKDIAGVILAPATEDGLIRYMTEYSHPVNFCPPSVGAIWLFGRFRFGPDWANDVLRKMGYQN